MVHETLPRPCDFPSLTKDKVRYGDTDRQGHVNNAVFSTYFETGRVELQYEKNELLANADASFVIAHIEIDYFNEIAWPGEIEIGTMVKKVGRSSIEYEQGIFQNEKCVAKGKSIIVQINKITKKPIPISEHAKAKLEKYKGGNEE